MTSLPENVSNLLRKICPEGRTHALHEPVIGEREKQLVKDCLDSGWVSSVGKYVDLFERRLEEFTGAKKAVACVNGTSALHVCLKLGGVEPGDEVLVPSLTFVATANSVSYCSAIPHFVESEDLTLGISPGRLDGYLKKIAVRKNGKTCNSQTGRPLKALVAVHTFGCPAEIDALFEICKTYGITFIEDAAESLGSFYKDRHTGNLGKLSALSFNGNKVITTGGGGAVLTNDEELGKMAKHITTTARLADRISFFHDQVGYNYRMPNINAALGCAQLERLPALLACKARLAEEYRTVFAEQGEISVFSAPPYSISNYWLNVLLLSRPDMKVRDEILKLTQSIGIMTRPAWTLMHRLPMYAACPRMELDNTEALEARIITVPSSPTLARGEK